MEFTADKRHAAGGSQRVVDFTNSHLPENTGASSRSSLLDKVLNRKNWPVASVGNCQV